MFRFAAPALIAGKVGLLKHASNVSQCALAIEEIFCRVGFEEGVFETLLIEPEQVEKLIVDPRVRAVTGDRQRKSWSGRRAGLRSDHPAHFAITYRHKCAKPLIGSDRLQAHLHLRFRCFISELADELGERRGIIHLADANRKIEKSFARQDGTRSEGGANQGVSN